ncbi:non-ribosomal peptide synthetase [Kitasatospora sp. NPDC059599]|uniref:non-ribosomal peptide synthetase n=1 Tax=Kitasatospora sp. NPDC059599 TaxID=3346880 RepID=UPI0036A518F1
MDTHARTQPSTPAAHPTGVHHLIGQHARQHPGAPAVREAVTGRELSYGDLWDLAGDLAARLTDAGLRPGDACGIALDRGAHLVVAVLAAARAGAFYVPLDLDAPAQRSAAQLADAAARFVVTASGDGRAAAVAPDLPRIEAVRTAGTAAPDHGRTGHDAGGDDPLYVNFTSGTSGRPKAVLVPHRAVLRLVDEPTYCTLRPGTRVANVANPAFDATTFEIWATLAARGTVVVMPSVAATGLDRWLDLLRAEGVAAMFLTTSLFHMIAQERPGALGTLETLLVGGEALSPEAARRVLAAGGPDRLVNVYGPTETTTFATYHDLDAEKLRDLVRAPIGSAIQHTELRVLGPDLAPVPDGDRGELAIGGPGVALGYLGRPELTAERFTTLPDAAGDGVFYRTGDLVRRLPDGSLEIFGRLDRQVKIRGFRVELEEVERAAVATGLATAAVVEKTGEGAAAVLVGFVLPAGDRHAPARTVTELQTALAGELPGYMLPTRWTVLDAIPLGPTGKADRDALLALDRPDTPAEASASDAASAPSASDAASVSDAPDPGDGPAPQDGDPATEVRRLWREVLEVAEARDEDNFIEAGGNSILAIQLAGRVNEAVSADLGPADVLLATDLADLTEKVLHSATARR